MTLKFKMHVWLKACFIIIGLLCTSGIYAQTDKRVKVSLQPQLALDYLRWGKMFSERANYKKAINIFSKAISCDSLCEDAYFYRAEAFFQLKKYKRALSDLNSSLKISSSSQDASASYHLRGLIKYELELYESSLDDFQKAIIGSDFLNENYLLDGARAYLRLDKLYLVQQNIKKVLSINPSLPEAFWVKALMEEKKGLLNSALLSCKRAISLGEQTLILPTDIGKYYNSKGNLLLKLGSIYQAKKAYIKAWKKGFDQALLGRAILELKLGNFALANKYSHQFVGKNHKHYIAKLIRLLSAFYISKGNIEGFEAKVNQLVNNLLHTEHKPEKLLHHFSQYLLNFAPTANNKELQNIRTSFLRKVIAIYRIILNRNPQKIKYYFRLATTYEKINNPLEAFICLKKLQSQVYKVTPVYKNRIRVEIQRLLSKIDDNTPPLVTSVSAKVAKTTNRFSQATITRGIEIKKSSEGFLIKGKVTDRGNKDIIGVSTVFINGNQAKIQFSENSFEGLIIPSRSELEKRSHTINVTIEAIDYKGNRSKQNFLVRRKKIAPVSPKSNPDSRTAFEGAKHYVLFFAGEKYLEWENLRNPGNDVNALAKELAGNYSFITEIVDNPTRAQILLKLREYALKAYRQDDQLLIFFAGHGVFDEVFKEGYLVARDSRVDDLLKSTYLSYGELKTYIANLPCRHVFLTLDVCFGGTFDRNIALAPSVKLRGKQNSDYKSTLQLTTRKFLSSGGKVSVPDGRPGYHSPFVRKFLDILRRNRSILRFSDLQSQLRSLSPTPVSGSFIGDKPGSDFFFVYDKHHLKLPLPQRNEK